MTQIVDSAISSAIQRYLVADPTLAVRRHGEPSNTRGACWAMAHPATAKSALGKIPTVRDGGLTALRPLNGSTAIGHQAACSRQLPSRRRAPRRLPAHAPPWERRMNRGWESAVDSG
jgi:hypothetical protein